MGQGRKGRFRFSSSVNQKLPKESAVHIPSPLHFSKEHGDKAATAGLPSPFPHGEPMAVLLWGECELRAGVPRAGVLSAPTHPLLIHATPPPCVHSQVCSMLDSLDRGYREESKQRKWPGLALPLGLPDSKHFQPALLPSSKESPEEPLKPGCPLRGLRTEE